MFDQWILNSFFSRLMGLLLLFFCENPCPLKLHFKFTITTLTVYCACAKKPSSHTICRFALKWTDTATTPLSHPNKNKNTTFFKINMGKIQNEYFLGFQEMLQNFPREIKEDGKSFKAASLKKLFPFYPLLKQNVNKIEKKKKIISWEIYKPCPQNFNIHIRLHWLSRLLYETILLLNWIIYPPKPFPPNKWSTEVSLYF